MANAGYDTAAPPRAGGSYQTASFVALWIAWAVLLAAAMILGNMDRHGSTWATAARMGSSVALVVAGWWAWGLWRGTAAGPYALAIAVGMTLGTIGDFFNANLITFVPLKDPTLGGIAAFGLGHVAYIAGCIYLAVKAHLTNRRAISLSVLSWQLVGVVAWYFVALEGTEGRALVWAALPYSLLLAGTAGITGGLALQNARLFPLALGAALFLASDLILAFGLFRGSFPHSTEAVWLTYGPGQMLIVFSTLAAAGLLLTRQALGEPAAPA